MKTLSTEFARNQLRSGVSSGWLVHIIVGGTSDVYLSEKSRHIGDVEALPYLIGMGSITDSVDYFSRNFSVGALELRIRNYQNDIDSVGHPVYVLADLSVWKGKQIKVYKIKGEDATLSPLTSMLLVYHGYVADVTSASIDEISISTTPLTKLLNIAIPPTMMGTGTGVFEDAPIDPNRENTGSKETRNLNQKSNLKVPLVYGSFTGSQPGNTDPTGMAIAVPTTPFYGTKRTTCVISDHPLKAMGVDGLYFKQPSLQGESVRGLPWFKTATVSLNTGGRGKVLSNDRAYVQIYPSGPGKEATSVSGGALFWDGLTWEDVSPVDGEGKLINFPRIECIWGLAADNFYLVGELGAIWNYTETWTEMTSNTTQNLYGIWGTSSSNLYAVGRAGTILHYDGVNWSAQTSGTTKTLYAIWGSSSTNIFAVGEGGTILHSTDGSTWTAASDRETGPVTNHLYSIWGPAGGDNIYVVGQYATVLRRKSGTWSKLTPPVGIGTTDLQGVWGAGTVVWVVGGSGWSETGAAFIRTLDGTIATPIWAQISIDTTTSFPTMMGISGVTTGPYAVGHKMILRFNDAVGTSGHLRWKTVPDIEEIEHFSFQSISVIDANNILVVGYRLKEFEEKTFTFYTSGKDKDVLTPTNFTNVYDESSTTYAYSKDSVDRLNGSSKEVISYFPLVFSDLGGESSLYNSIGKIIGEGYLKLKAIETNANSVDIAFRWYINIKPSGDVYLPKNNATQVALGVITSGLDYSFPFDERKLSVYQAVAGNITTFNFAKIYGWHFGQSDLAPEGHTIPLTFLIIATAKTGWVNTGNNSDQILNNNEILRVYYAYLQLEYEPVNISEFWAVCEGKKYGSWIDTGGRTFSPSEGELIEDPAYILEDWIRTYTDLLDINASAIDTASFDEAANPNVIARFNFSHINAGSLASFIKPLVEQSTFMFGMTSTGKCRAIALNNTNPTVNKTILWHWLDGNIKLGETDLIVNSSVVSSRYWQEHGSYADVEYFGNATSITANGDRPGDHNFTNICGDSVTVVMALRMTDATSIMTRKIKKINISLLDTFGIDLEVGDWISLDYNSIDSHFLYFGATWANHKFLVQKVTIKPDGVDIEAVELYE